MTRPPRQRARVSAVFTVAVALLCAAPALAANVLKVRVGDHPEFTRVVFELDRASGYRVVRHGDELEVTVDAATRRHRIAAHGDVRGVAIDAGPNAVARIPLGKSDLRLREMILADPPRIVLDLVRPEPKPVAKAKAAAPKPKPVAKATPEPEPVAPPAPEPKPEPIAQVEPEPTPEPVAPAPEPEPVVAEVAEPQPEPEPVVEPEPSEEIAAVDPGVEPLEFEPAEPMPLDEPVMRPEMMQPAQIAEVPPPAPPLAKPAPKPAAPSAPGFTDRLASDPVWQAGAVGAAVLLVGIVLIWRRRRRTLPNDLDVAAIAEEAEADAAGAAASTAETAAEAEAAEADSASDTDSGSSADDLFDAPALKDSGPSRLEPLPSLGATPEPAPVETAAADDSADSLFDDTQDGDLVAADASEGEASMDPNMDLPTDSTMPPTPPPAMGGAAAPDADVARMLQQLEQRIQTLESKLDESNEAREKLERQVAAQSEELRVQRAAIARTQRALRTMSRGDEEKATEPALRDGDTQTKTRVNV